MFDINYYNEKFKENLDSIGNDMGEWKLVGEVTGTNQINLPSEFNELKVCSYYEDYYYSRIITRSDIENIDNISRDYLVVGDTNPSRTDVKYHYTYWSIYKTYLNLSSFYTQSQVRDSSTTKLYYR